MAVTYVELESSRTHSVNQYGQWEGSKEFSSPRADVETNRELIRAVTWSVNTVALTPKRVYVSAWQDPTCPGNSRIRAVYSNMENPERYKVGKSYLSIHVDTRRRIMDSDLDTTAARQVFSTQPAADGTYFRPIKGSDLHFVPIPQAVVRLTTAYSTASIDFATMYGKAGKVNAAAVSVAGKVLFAIGTLKLMSVDIPQWYTWDADSAIIPIIYTFSFRPETWAGAGSSVSGDKLKTAASYAGKYRKGVIKDYALSPNDAPTSATRTYIKPDGSDTTDSALAKFRLIKVERPAYLNAGTDDGSRKVAQTADFATGGMFEILAWTP